MSTVTRTRMSGAQRRRQILDVTKAIVGGEGFHAVSIDRVARDAGITRPVVYTHFGDLPGLLDALIERESERALTGLIAIMPAEIADESPGEQLLTTLRAYLEAVAADPVTWRLILMPPEGTPDSLRQRVVESRSAIVALLAPLASAGLGSGDSPDPELSARAMSALADESARLVLTDPKTYPIDRVITHARWLLERLGRR